MKIKWFQLKKSIKFPKKEIKCYEVHRANIPQYGCTKQCNECKIIELKKNGNN